MAVKELTVVLNYDWFSKLSDNVVNAGVWLESPNLRWKYREKLHKIYGKNHSHFVGRVKVNKLHILKYYDIWPSTIYS